MLILLLYGVNFLIEPSGDLYILKYTGDSKRYNMDVGAGIKVKLLKYKKFSFFVSYVNELDMAKQVGNISLDPYYGHWYITGGFELALKNLLLFGHITHDCLHSVDRPPDSNKVVFNRFSIGMGNIPFFPIKQRITRDSWRFTYTYYPHSRVIDYLNSVDMWHDFRIFFKKRLYFQNAFFINGGIETLFTLWINEENPKGFTQTNIVLNFEAGYENKNKALLLIFEYFPLAEYQFKAPQGLWRIGVGYLF